MWYLILGWILGLIVTLFCMMRYTNQLRLANAHLRNESDYYFHLMKEASNYAHMLDVPTQSKIHQKNMSHKQQYNANIERINSTGKY